MEVFRNAQMLLELVDLAFLCFSFYFLVIKFYFLVIVLTC